VCLGRQLFGLVRPLVFRLAVFDLPVLGYAYFSKENVVFVRGHQFSVCLVGPSINCDGPQ
jgi:hypothetical protein